MTELEIEELDRKVTGSDSVIPAEARRVEALPEQVEDKRSVLPDVAAEEQAGSLDEEEVVIAMAIPEMIDKGRKDKLSALRNVPKEEIIRRNC